MRKIILVILTLGFCLIANVAKSAQIYHLGNNVFTLLGPIVSGDYQRFEQLVRNIPYGNGGIFLNSQGGAAYEGIWIGELVRKKGFATVVVAGNECYSACAIIWAAGQPKMADLPQSIIGFHGIYNGYTGEQSGSGNAKLGAVLGRWGYSDMAIEFMTDRRPSEFNYLTGQTAYNYGISYVPFSQNNTFQRPQTSYNLSPYDVVYGFYSALSVADGDLAAAYVIPEKRGIGPFNQSNIYRFYSSLRQPLQIQSIIQINNNQFNVNYSFVAGRNQCNGRALVTLANRNGYYLIQSIKANC